MNLPLWQRHLESRNAKLEREVRRLRVLLHDEKQRSELWKHRALTMRRR